MNYIRPAWTVLNHLGQEENSYCKFSHFHSVSETVLVRFLKLYVDSKLETYFFMRFRWFLIKLGKI